VVTLVPDNFFDPARAGDILSELADLNENETVRYKEIPWYNSHLIYSISGEENILPEMYFILESLPKCRDYNKIVCSFKEGFLSIAIAQGNNLSLVNEYRASDFTTAQYFIFLAVKSLQLNPEITTICWRTALDEDQEMSLCRYFKAVEQL